MFPYLDISVRKKALSVKKDAEDALNPTLRDNIMRVVVNVLRGERFYTSVLRETIAQIGSCPSAGGSRADIAIIISHMGKGYFAQETSWPLAYVRYACAYD